MRVHTTANNAYIHFIGLTLDGARVEFANLVCDSS